MSALPDDLRATRRQMQSVRVAFLGYGNVARALVALLDSRRDALARRHGIAYRVTGVSSRRRGWFACAEGLDPAAPEGVRCRDVSEWLAVAQPDVVFETLPLDPHAGQPALDWTRRALDAGAHVISANKGPVVHGYDELSRLAASRHVRWRFESAVMDGAPVFSLVRRCLPLAGIAAVRGVFTSTATVVLEAIESGATVQEGIARAQWLGVAEADPSHDVDGWDSAVKLCAIARVLFASDLMPAEVEREGVRAVDAARVRAAREAGAPVRLVGRIAREADGAVIARVAPEPIPPDDPLSAARGTTLITHFEADVFPGGLTVTSHDPDLRTTAYGMLTDLVDVLDAS